MNNLWTSVLIILSFALLGYAVGRFFRPALLKRNVVFARINSLVLWLLIAAMGYRLGSDHSLIARLGELGLTALILAVLTSGGSVLAALGLGWATRWAERKRTGSYSGEGIENQPGWEKPGTDETPGQSNHPGAINRLALLKEPAVLIAVMGLGILVGWLAPGLIDLEATPITEVLLYLLLFLAGLGMALESSGGVKRLLHVNTLLLPVATALGSLAGGGIAALVLDLSLSRGLAAAAGFGWYSLSGVLITDLGDAFLGNAAFLSNLLRESLALLSIPVLAASGRSLASISIAGATSMDVTLPMISRYNGYQVMGLSMVHGVILSILVPVLVPLFMALPG